MLRPDGTYEESSARGTYVVQGDRIVFSESKVRGPGRLDGGNKIVFEYTYNNQPHVVTYLRQEGSEAPADSPPPGLVGVRRA